MRVFFFANYFGFSHLVITLVYNNTELIQFNTMFIFLVINVELLQIHDRLTVPLLV